VCNETRIGGRGLVAALQAIEEAGSLRSAAEKLGINYRRLWTRIKQAEKLLGKRLVVSDKRGSKLTEEAKKIITAYQEATRRLREAGLLDGLDTGAECSD